MDRSTSTKTQTLKPTRRKLQKCDPKLKVKMAKRASSDSTASTIPSSEASRRPSAVSRQLAPDLSDSIWNHYLDDSPADSTLHSPAIIAEPDNQEVRPFREPRKNPLPEFSHLTISDAAARPSLDSSSMPSPASSTSTTSARRRQAKTPVFRIGQLERPIFGREHEPAEKTSSVDLIAEQYRALLDTRPPDIDSLHGDSHPDQLPPQDALEVPPSPMPRNSSASAKSKIHLHPAQATDPSRISPRQSQKTQKTPADQPSPFSDDGELVAFEEDVIYFKPISFDPEPTPSPRSQTFQLGSTQMSPPDNISLQISLDLLTRELSSTVADRSQRSGPDTTALQIWVMIEAYERLQDHVMRMALHNQEMKNVGLMFNSWLGALYAIHSTLTGYKSSSDSEYDGLEEALD